MTGNEIITFFEQITDEAPSQDLEVNLLNNAKNKHEMERDWEYLKRVDETNSTAGGNTVDTAYDLPTRFLTALSNRTMFVGTREHFQIQFELKQVFKDSSFRFFIDQANDKFHITGKRNKVEIIHFYYIQTTVDWTTGTLDSLSPSFPAGDHALLAFDMAELYQAGIDADDISFRMSAQNIKQQALHRNNLIHWDARLKLAALNAASRVQSRDYELDPDIVTPYARSGRRRL